MSLATYLLIPADSVTVYKKCFFSNPAARRYSFLPEYGAPDLLNKAPRLGTWQSVIIQQYSTLPTLLDKNTAIPTPHNHKASLRYQQQQDEIAILEQCINHLQQLKMPFGFGVLDLGSKRGWQKCIPITALPDNYQEATLYWLTP